jgi:hypothetical protein
VPKSFALRAADLRAVYRLVGECRELGDEHLRWHRHLFAGLAGLVGGGVAMGGEIAGIRSGRLVPVGPVDWGGENGFDRVGWERGLVEARGDPRLNRLGTFTQYCARTAASDGVCLARTDLITDSVWDRAWDFRNMVEPSGADHSLYCFRSIPGLVNHHSGVIIARALRQADFSARQKAVVREAMAEVVPKGPCPARPAGIKVLPGGGHGQAGRCTTPSHSAHGQRIRQSHLPALRRQYPVRASRPMGQAGLGEPVCLG